MRKSFIVKFSRKLYIFFCLSYQVPVWAIYTYDAVKVYAMAVDQILRRNGDICNGTEVVRTIIEMESYPSDIQGINVSNIFPCPVVYSVHSDLKA